MPFAREFDDVYATIRTSVETAYRESPVRCFRLDESRPAGRITERLLEELRSASICIADLTGSKPNVMWEVGYAMALGKPTIIVTQEKGELPFDIRDMETLHYDRNHLSETLGQPLRRATIDTMSTLLSTRNPESNTTSTSQNDLIGELLAQIGELRSMVSQAVRTWNPTPEQERTLSQSRESLVALEGAWINPRSQTHLYARVIDDELVMPYCYGGNDSLTSVYYGWKKTGEFFFGRFRWLSREVSGFAFFKQESVDLLTGAWWGDDELREIPQVPNFTSGVSSRWERKRNMEFPSWALRFFEDVQRGGIVNCLTRRTFDWDR